MNWLKRLLGMKQPPAFSETYSDPGVEFEGKVVKTFESSPPYGICETFSDPGVEFTGSGPIAEPVSATQQPESTTQH